MLENKPAQKAGLFLCGVTVKQVQCELLFVRLKLVYQEFNQLVTGQAAGAECMGKLSVKNKRVTAFNLSAGTI